MLIGADEGDIGFAMSYVLWTIVAGGIPTILSNVCANLARAEGQPRMASFGMITGCVLNMVLDPLFMFVILPSGNEVTGAAIATALSNLVSLVFFIILIVRMHRGGVSAGRITVRGLAGQLAEIVPNGLPGFCMVALSMLSNCFLNSMMSALGSGAVAGIGIVRKIDQLAYAVNQGITQGMLPLAAYCYASGRRKRLFGTIVISGAITEIFSVLCTVLSVTQALLLVSIFIRDSETIAWGAEFLRVIALCVPLYSITFVIIAFFQAVGKEVEPFILSVLHKGSLDIALLFVIRALAGVRQIVWANVISEVATLTLAVILVAASGKKIFRKHELQVSTD